MGVFATLASNASPAGPWADEGNEVPRRGVFKTELGNGVLSPDSIPGLSPPKAESPSPRAGVPKTVEVGDPKIFESVKNAEGGSKGVS